MKIKAPRRKARSSDTSARSMDTSAPLARTGSSESNLLHPSIIFLSFQSSVTPMADWDTKRPCALRKRRTRCAIKPQDPQARQCKARQQLSTTTLPAYSVGTTTTSTSTIPVGTPNPSVVEMHLHLYPIVYPSLRMPSIKIQSPIARLVGMSVKKKNRCAQIS